MFRPAAIVALALQLLGCVAPANAFILCISDDGCVELELAAPGTTRCPEQSCDTAHAGDAHGCADIPVLHDSLGPARAQSGDWLMPAVLAAPLAVIWRPAPANAPSLPNGAPAAARAAHRTVVLQL